MSSPTSRMHRDNCGNGFEEDIAPQHMRDLKLAIEFKYLMKHAPGGIYLVPEFEVFCIQQSPIQHLTLQLSTRALSYT